jgi:hypothetical protein
MMTNNDRNIRTLVICFVLAVMALLPLRMVEMVDYAVTNFSDVKVLGEVTFEQKEVILPNAELEEEVLESVFLWN